MKTAVVYSSGKGYVSEIAGRIADQLAGKADLFDLGKKMKMDLSEYDALVVAGSVVAGRFNGKVKKFLQKNIGKMDGKKVYLMYAGLDDKEYMETVKKKFGEETLSGVTEVIHGGGRYLPGQHGAMVKKIMAKINGAEGALHREKPENIDRLIKLLT
jgi:menaquinone-dependent protoporphyrinogen oxidase